MTTQHLQQPFEERMGAWKVRRRRYHLISTLWSVLFICPVVFLGTYFALILVDAAGPLLSGEVGYGHPEYFGRQSYVNTHSVLLGAFVWPSGCSASSTFPGACGRCGTGSPIGELPTGFSMAFQTRCFFLTAMPGPLSPLNPVLLLQDPADLGDS